MKNNKTRASGVSRVEKSKLQQRQKRIVRVEKLLGLEPREQKSPPKRNAPRYDEDIYDERRDFVEADEVINLLRAIEWNRRALRDAALILHKWLDGSPGFAESWREFVAFGGVSAADFERFLDDRMRYKPTKQKRHLRLVASKQNPSGDPAQSWR